MPPRSCSIAVAPLLWLAHASLVTRELSSRQAVRAGWRIGVLSVIVSLWWLVALAVQARYGADVLSYSETLTAVSSTSLASEVLRGLGYWLFYGGDVTGRWTGASTPYLQSVGLIGLGLGLAGLGLLGIVLVRWRDRTFLAGLVAVGTVLAVGAHGASPVANALQGSARDTLVLALRSSTRAVPVVLLGLVFGVAALLTAWTPRLPRATLAASAAVGLLAVLHLPALWTGGVVDPVLRHPEELPSWWHEAATRLDAAPPGYRVLELPGAEFAAHRWGITQDPILPGLTDRPTIARDLLPLGGAAAMDLLFAIDDRFQNGIAEGSSIAPVARLLGADQIMARGDVAFDRYQGPRPQDTWALYQSQPEGLGPPATFGPEQANLPSVAMEDEWALSSRRAGTTLPPLALVPVEDPQPIVRAVDDARTVLLAGSGAGVVDAAAAGLLRGDELMIYSADRAAPATVPPGSLLVITDSNRKQAHQWRGSQDTTGFTEDAGPGLLVPDEADHRLPVFGEDGGGPAEQTLAEQRGGVRATASAYGEPNGYRPEARAFFAVDGDPATAWTVGDRGPVGGSTLRLDLEDETDLTTVRLTQPLQPANRRITRVQLRTAAGQGTADLDASSWAPPGQLVELPPGRSSWLEIEVVGDTAGHLASYAAQDAVGFAEVSLDGLVAEEVVRTPTALLSDLGASSADHPLAIVLTRERVNPTRRWRDDPEPALTRSVTLPTTRSFRISGTARVSRRAPDAVLSALTPPTGTAAVASSRLAGVPSAGGPAAVDGDPATAWQTAFGPAAGTTLSVTTPAPLTLDHLDLQVLADGRHSVPTALTISNGQEARSVTIPPVADVPGQGPVLVPLDLPALTGRSFVVTIDATRDVTTLDRHFQEPVVMPVGIAELGLPATAQIDRPDAFDTGCRDDLLSVDGQPVPVRISGSRGDADDGTPLPLQPCGVPSTLTLGPGEHVVRSAPRHEHRPRRRSRPAGLGRGRGSRPVLARRSTPVTYQAQAALVTSSGRTSRRIEVTGGDGPFWLVFGESLNPGWKATANGADLGAPRPVDGGFNGWQVERIGPGPVVITLTWEPQRFVWAGLAASLAGVVACVVLVILGGRSRTVTAPTVSTDPSHGALGPPSPRRWHDAVDDAPLSWPSLAVAAWHRGRAHGPLRPPDRGPAGGRCHAGGRSPAEAALAVRGGFHRCDGPHRDVLPRPAGEVAPRRGVRLAERLRARPPHGTGRGGLPGRGRGAQPPRGASSARSDATVRSNPSRNPIRGSHPSSDRARVMSGRRRAGSPARPSGSRTTTTEEDEPVTSRISAARSAMLTS